MSVEVALDDALGGIGGDGEDGRCGGDGVRVGGSRGDSLIQRHKGEKEKETVVARGGKVMTTHLGSVVGGSLCTIHVLKHLICVWGALFFNSRQLGGVVVVVLLL